VRERERESVIEQVSERKMLVLWVDYQEDEMITKIPFKSMKRVTTVSVNEEKKINSFSSLKVVNRVKSKI
jgi:hypothetical protein